MVRRATVWGRLRTAKPTPDPGHHSFVEHDALVAAIANRDMDLAAACMRRHLEMVRRKLLRSEEHTSELQSLQRNSYAVFCQKKQKTINHPTPNYTQYHIR